MTDETKRAALILLGGVIIGLVLPWLPTIGHGLVNTRVSMPVLVLILVGAGPATIAAVWVRFLSQRIERLTHAEQVEELGKSLLQDVDRADALREAANLLDVFIIEVDMETGTFAWGNAALTNFIGRSVEGMAVATWMEEVVTPDTRQHTEEYYASFAEDHDPNVRHLVNCLRGTDERVRELRWTSLPTHPASQSAFALGVVQELAA